MPATSLAEPSPFDEETPFAGAGGFPLSFGPYVLLHRLARGGMGNVFLAKTGGLMGIEKHCVVKTLRAQFTGNAEYVARFVEEARLVVQLTHRNICPVFDVGCVGGLYYLAMEHVQGCDLRAVDRALKAREQRLKPALAIHIATEMLDALDYAHRHADPVSGEPLRLVHRDVSPANVMINVEGEVKLIDFGLAEQTEPLNSSRAQSSSSVVMGKLAYMAPEHARGERVDARADQFSAAVLLYELLLGARYYSGLTAEQVWRCAGSGAFRPAGLATLQPELRDVVTRALHPDAAERYPTCADFRDALIDVARAADLHPVPRELRELVSDIASGTVAETRELLQRFAHVSTTAKPGFMAPPRALTTGDEAFTIATSVHASRSSGETDALARSSETVVLAPPSRPRFLVAAAAAAVVTVAVVAWALTRAEPETPREPMNAAPPVAQVTAPPVLDPLPTPAPADAGFAATEGPPPPREPRASTGKPSGVRRPTPAPAHPKPPPVPAASAGVGTKKMTNAERVDLLHACRTREPCAADLSQQGVFLGAMAFDETVKFRNAADACLKRCYR